MLMSMVAVCYIFSDFSMGEPALSELVQEVKKMNENVVNLVRTD